MVKIRQGVPSVKDAQEIAARLAEKHGVELVEVTLQKDGEGMALCIYIDQEAGITLSDCESFHKAVQPLLEEFDYDYLEVSSPGADRPVKTLRDFEKHKGNKVEIKLFAKLDGVKQFTGTLDFMTEIEVTITAADGDKKTFPLKAVALIKPVIVLTDNEN